MLVERVERHIITRNDVNYKAIDDICFRSKNLYNYANYALRQSFIHTGKLPNEFDLVKKFRERENEVYYKLFGNVNQQCIRLLYKNWKSFFRAIKDWSKNKAKYLGKPKLPKYKDKNGRNIAIFTIVDCRIKNGFIHFNSKASLKPIRTLVDNLQQVRIVPQSSCYVVEVTYKYETSDFNLNKNNFLSIDPGVGNFATCYNSHDNKSFIINGKIVKSMNQFYNKKKANLMSYAGNKCTSNRLKQLTLKRNNKINDFMHKASKFIIVYCIEHDIGSIVIGHNKGWKQETHCGKRNNQNFVSIPYNKFFNMLKYKAENFGIQFILTEESYSSKVDHSALEPMKHSENYLGKRVKRGLFKRADDKVINADLNGAVGILRKVIDESLFKEIVNRGFVVNPVKINILTKDCIKVLY